MHRSSSVSFISNHVSSLANNPTLVPRGKYFAMANMTVSTNGPALLRYTMLTDSRPSSLIQEYPVARGHAHIAHAEDVSAPLDFVPGFLESSVPCAPPSLITFSHL